MILVEDERGQHERGGNQDARSVGDESCWLGASPLTSAPCSTPSFAEKSATLGDIFRSLPPPVGAGRELARPRRTLKRAAAWLLG